MGENIFLWVYLFNHKNITLSSLRLMRETKRNVFHHQWVFETGVENLGVRKRDAISKGRLKLKEECGDFE